MYYCNLYKINELGLHFILSSLILTDSCIPLSVVIGKKGLNEKFLYISMVFETHLFLLSSAQVATAGLRC